MKPIQLDEDVIPVSEFKANTAKWIERIRETGRPVLLTQNGRSAAVVMNPADYDNDRFDRSLITKFEEGRRKVTTPRRGGR